MDFNELIVARRSVRDYRPEMPSDEAIRKVVDAGRLAPSAGNFQPWLFLVAKGDEAKEAIRSSYVAFNRTASAGVPVMVVVCGDHATSWKRKSDGKDFCDVDAAIATDHMTLMAAELGLGTCWICGFDREALAANLGLSGKLEPIAVLHLGYPAGDGADGGGVEKKRKPLDEVLRFI